MAVGRSSCRPVPVDNQLSRPARLLVDRRLTASAKVANGCASEPSAVPPLAPVATWAALASVVAGSPPAPPSLPRPRLPYRRPPCCPTATPQPTDAAPAVSARTHAAPSAASITDCAEGHCHCAPPEVERSGTFGTGNGLRARRACVCARRAAAAIAWLAAVRRPRGAQRGDRCPHPSPEALHEVVMTSDLALPTSGVALAVRARARRR